VDFFSKCQTQEEAKKVFKKLCKYFHPDRGGDDELIIELYKQYDAWKPIDNSGKGHANDAFRYASGGVFTSSLLNVYEKKVREADEMIYYLRNQVDDLKRKNDIREGFRRDEWNCQNKIQKDLEAHLEKLIKKCADLENNYNERYDKFNKMTLLDKVRFVLGYE